MKKSLLIAIVLLLAACSTPKAQTLSVSDTLEYANIEAENTETAALAYYADNNALPLSSNDLENKYLNGKLRAYYIFNSSGKIVGATPMPPDGWNGMEWSPDTQHWYEAGTSPFSLELIT